MKIEYGEELIYTGKKENCMPKGTVCKLLNKFDKELLVKDEHNQTWLIPIKDLKLKYEKPKTKILWRK